MKQLIIALLLIASTPLFSGDSRKAKLDLLIEETRRMRPEAVPLLNNGNFSQEDLLSVLDHTMMTESEDQNPTHQKIITALLYKLTSDSLKQLDHTKRGFSYYDKCMGQFCYNTAAIMAAAGVRVSWQSLDDLLGHRIARPHLYGDGGIAARKQLLIRTIAFKYFHNENPWAVETYRTNLNPYGITIVQELNSHREALLPEVSAFMKTKKGNPLWELAKHVKDIRGK